MACANSLFPKSKIMYLILHIRSQDIVWITKPSAFVKYVINFVEEYVKNNTQKIKFQHI